MEYKIVKTTTNYEARCLPWSGKYGHAQRDKFHREDRNRKENRESQDTTRMEGQAISG